MSQTPTSSCHRNKRPLGATLPDFIPNALYVAIVERTVPPTDRDDPSPPTIQESLEIFYREEATSAPIGSSPDVISYIDVHYWALLPSKQPKNGTMSIYNAVCNKDVLGYVRVAEFVAPRLLRALIQADDRKVPAMEPMSSEIYVFNALERLRRHAVFEANMGAWKLENFLIEINKFRDEFKKEGLQKMWNVARPFIDFPLILFREQVHWWEPRVAEQQAKKRDGP